MAKRYTRINWQNSPNVATPLSAENLNKMDKGIDDCDNAIEVLTNQIATLNNNLATQYGTLMPGDFDLSNPSPSYNYVKKVGKVVQLGINVTVNFTGSVATQKTICTIPTGFRPSRNIYTLGKAVVNGNVTAIYVYIYVSGTVNVTLPAGTVVEININTTWIMD